MFDCRFGRLKKHCFILILSLAAVPACQNSEPTVTMLNSGAKPKTPVLPPKDSANFTQLSAGSQKVIWSPSGYKGTLRISQPLGRLQATSASSYVLQGSVTLQK